MFSKAMYYFKLYICLWHWCKRNFKIYIVVLSYYWYRFASSHSL